MLDLCHLQIYAQTRQYSSPLIKCPTGHVFILTVQDTQPHSDFSTDELSGVLVSSPSFFVWLGCWSIYTDVANSSIEPTWPVSGLSLITDISALNSVTGNL